MGGPDQPAQVRQPALEATVAVAISSPEARTTPVTRLPATRMR
jgi:hypothetical protein